MKVSEVTEQDAVMAASLSQTLAVSEKLLDALKLAGLPVTGPGLDKRSDAAKWLLSVMRQMAEQLKAAAPTATPTAASAMRIKNIGPIGSGKPQKKKKTK